MGGCRSLSFLRALTQQKLILLLSIRAVYHDPPLVSSCSSSKPYRPPPCSKSLAKHLFRDRSRVHFIYSIHDESKFSFKLFILAQIGNTTAIHTHDETAASP